MRNSGIKNYRTFAEEALEIVNGSPISFEVFSDDLDEMYKQAIEISSWGKNVNVKIPVTNTLGISTKDLLSSLSKEGVFCNVTAIFTIEQIETTYAACDPNCPLILSVFAGRIADTGIDPVPIMSEAIKISEDREHVQVLWASPREVLNIKQADQIGCNIITLTDDLLKKLSNFDKNLTEFSLETV